MLRATTARVAEMLLHKKKRSHLPSCSSRTAKHVFQVEQHMVDGELKTLLVHRKGATRAFPPHHPLIPVDYQFTGQPVIVGGTMGTCSYVLTGTQKGMSETFGSTCHGAGRAKSRNESRYRGGDGAGGSESFFLIFGSQ